MSRIAVALVAACFSASLFAQSPAQSPPVSLKGHDPVSYFTDGRPVKGSPAISHDFDETRYLFSSPKNRERFASSPERYTPQFTGLCATGMAYGVKAEADPSVWKIIDGKLYVFSSAQAREKFEQNAALLAKAQQNYQPRR